VQCLLSLGCHRPNPDIYVHQALRSGQPDCLRALLNVGLPAMQFFSVICQQVTRGIYEEATTGLELVEILLDWHNTTLGQKKIALEDAEHYELRILVDHIRKNIQNSV